jgi:hypothetical protein
MLISRDDFLADVEDGMQVAPMSIRLTPHILSVIDWSNPVEDPVRRQFIPLKSTLVADHRALTLDSLHETGHSPVEGLVHRYPDKVLFLGESAVVIQLIKYTNSPKRPRSAPCTAVSALGPMQSAATQNQSQRLPSVRHYADGMLCSSTSNSTQQFRTS